MTGEYLESLDADQDRLVSVSCVREIICVACSFHYRGHGNSASEMKYKGLLSFNSASEMKSKQDCYH